MAFEGLEDLGLPSGDLIGVGALRSPLSLLCRESSLLTVLLGNRADCAVRKQSSPSSITAGFAAIFFSTSLLLEAVAIGDVVECATFVFSSWRMPVSLNLVRFRGGDCSCSGPGASVDETVLKLGEDGSGVVDNDGGEDIGMANLPLAFAL